MSIGGAGERVRVRPFSAAIITSREEGTLPTATEVLDIEVNHSTLSSNPRTFAGAVEGAAIGAIAGVNINGLEDISGTNRCGSLRHSALAAAAGIGVGLFAGWSLAEQVPGEEEGGNDIALVAALAATGIAFMDPGEISRDRILATIAAGPASVLLLAAGAGGESARGLILSDQWKSLAMTVLGMVAGGILGGLGNVFRTAFCGLREENLSRFGEGDPLEGVSSVIIDQLEGAMDALPQQREIERPDLPTATILDSDDHQNTPIASVDIPIAIVLVDGTEGTAMNDRA